MGIIKTYGIDSMGFFVPEFSLDIRKLCEYRGKNYDNQLAKIGQKRISLTFKTPSEMAYEALKDVMSHDAALDIGKVGRLVVATETPEDLATPKIGLYVHDKAGLSSDCEVYEVRAACAAGGYALLDSIRWCKENKDRKAVVLCTDIAKYDVGSAEPTQGSGAVAIVVDSNPTLLRIDTRRTGTFSKKVDDFCRPVGRDMPIVNGPLSLECYHKAIEEVDGNFYRNGGKIPDYYTNLVFHIPFPRILDRAHLDEDFILKRHNIAITKGNFQNYTKRDRLYNQFIGNAYTASSFFALASLLEILLSEEKLTRGGEVRFIFYGSGCTAKTFSGRLTDNSTSVVSKFRLGERLLDQHDMPIEEYEKWREQRI